MTPGRAPHIREVDTVGSYAGAQEVTSGRQDPEPTAETQEAEAAKEARRLRIGPAGVRIREADTAGLVPAEIDAIRALMDVAFGDDEEERFTEEDWNHAVGGRHFLAEVDGSIVGHASVVERELRVGEQVVRTGYVEAVAIDPRRQGLGLGSVLMNDVNAYIRANFELGALGTGRHRFYERLGWRTWHGPSSVRTPDGEQRTPEDDGYLLVLETPSTAIAPLDLHAPISCEWRAGDVW